MENQIYALLFIGILLLAINYFVTRMAVKNGTKDALKQSEYYLEIIAKYFNEKSKK